MAILKPLIDFIGHIHLFAPMARAGSKTLMPMGPNPRIPTLCTFHGDGLFHSIYTNGQWFRNGSFIIGHAIRDFKTAGLGHHDKLGERALGLSRASQESQIPAGMRPAGLALVTFPAGHGWFNGNAVAGLHHGYPLPNCLHLTGSFMSYSKRILHHLTPNLS